MFQVVGSPAVSQMGGRTSICKKGKTKMSSSEISKKANMAAQGVLWGKVEVPEMASTVGLIGHEQNLDFLLDCKEAI